VSVNDLRILYLTYDWRESVIPYPCGTTYPDVFKRLNEATWIIIYKDLYEKNGNKGFHDHIIKLIEKENINVVFYAVAIDFEIHIDFLNELKRNAFVVLYLGDDCFYFDVHYKYLSQCADLILTNIVYAKYKYEELGTHAIFYPPAFDTSIYHPIENLERDIDVSFIGRIINKKDRTTFLNYLLHNKINVEIWGDGSANGVAPMAKKLEIYNRSKINLDFTGLTANTIYTLEHPIHRRIKHIKGRSIEIALTKSFLLSEYAPGIEAFFEPGKEIEVFYDKEDLMAKVRYYLDNPEERESMAKNAYKKALKNNEVYSQVKDMLSVIRQYKNGSEVYKRSKDPTIYLGKDYISNYSTYRIYWILKFLKLKKQRLAWEEFVIWLNYRRINLIQAAFFFSENISLVKRCLKLLKNYIPRFRDET
jgi:spore maturation protein CgeB